jgi:hypothetical protein
MNTIIIVLIIVLVIILITNSSSTKPEEATETTYEQSVLQKVAFALGLKKNTDFNADGGGNTIFLDRHDINCDGQPINQFKLSRNPANWNQLRYDYQCSSGGNLGQDVSKNTDFNNDGAGNTIFLDRHDIKCGSNEVLSQFKLNRNPANGGQYRYDYKCKTNNDQQPLSCRAVTTSANDFGKGSTIFLDRHDIKCNDDEVLNQFKLTRPTDGTINFNYTCCKY